MYGRTNRAYRRRSTDAHWPITVRECPFVDFERLLQLRVLKREDPCALLGSIFLDIFAVSGPIFLKTNFTSSCIIVHYIKSDNQIAEAPSHPLLNLPFNVKPTLLYF